MLNRTNSLEISNLLPPGQEAAIAYSASQIQAAIKRIASQVQEWLRSDSCQYVLVPILDGAMPFATDLLREMPADCVIESIRTKSYGKSGVQGGVKLFEPFPDVDGKRVLLIEDIADSGSTLEAVTQLCHDLGASEVKIACLLNRVNNDRLIQPDFSGIQHEGPEWFFGYGLDLDGKFRSLTDIYALERSREEGGIGPSGREYLVEDTFSFLKAIPETFSDMNSHKVPLELSESSIPHLDGLEAIKGLLEFSNLIDEKYETSPRAPFETQIHRLKLLSETAKSFLWDSSLAIEERPIRPLVVAFKGSVIRGKHDPSDLDVIIYYDVENYNRGENQDINNVLLTALRREIDASDLMNDAFGATLRSRGLAPGEFPIDLSSGGDLRYKHPELRMLLEDAVLLFTKGEGQGGLAVRFLTPGNEWIRRVNEQGKL